jgi:hypothetical protein
MHLKKVFFASFVVLRVASRNRLLEATKIKLPIWGGNFNSNIGDDDFRNKRLFLLSIVLTYHFS